MSTNIGMIVPALQPIIEHADSDGFEKVGIYCMTVVIFGNNRSLPPHIPQPTSWSTKPSIMPKMIIPIPRMMSIFLVPIEIWYHN